jgi:YfiH family protein
MFNPIKPLSQVAQNDYISLTPDYFAEEIVALSSTAHAGNMSFKNGDQNAAHENRKNLFQKLELGTSQLIIIQPNHADHIAIVTKKYLCHEGLLKINSDALLTKTKNLILGLATADCIPIFFYEPIKKIIGLAHVGRRGAELNILTKTLTKIINSGGDITKVKIYLGPGIQRCCYSFPAEPFEAEFTTRGWLDFSSKFRDNQGKIISYNLDLYGRVISQLVNFAGKKGEKLSIYNIERSQFCTHCSGMFFSHRRSQIENRPEQRFLSLIMMK